MKSFLATSAPKPFPFYEQCLWLVIRGRYMATHKKMSYEADSPNLAIRLITWSSYIILFITDCFLCTHLSPASRSKCPLKMISYKLLSTSSHGSLCSEHTVHVGDMVANTAGGTPPWDNLYSLLSVPSHPGMMERCVQLCPQSEAKGVRVH